MKLIKQIKKKIMGLYQDKLKKERKEMQGAIKKRQEERKMLALSSFGDNSISSGLTSNMGATLSGVTTHYGSGGPTITTGSGTSSGGYIWDTTGTTDKPYQTTQYESPMTETSGISSGYVYVKDLLLTIYAHGRERTTNHPDLQLTANVANTLNVAKPIEFIQLMKRPNDLVELLVDGRSESGRMDFSPIGPGENWQDVNVQQERLNNLYTNLMLNLKEGQAISLSYYGQETRSRLIKMLDDIIQITEMIGSEDKGNRNAGMELLKR